MVELVKYIAQSLVDKPEAVDVRQVEGEENITIELRVDPDDMGKVMASRDASPSPSARWSRRRLRRTRSPCSWKSYNTTHPPFFEMADFS